MSSRRPIPNRKRLKKAAIRYGLNDLVRPDGKADDLRSIARYYFEIAKRMLVRDGYHIAIAILILPDKSHQPCELSFDDQADKFVVWRQVARNVKKQGRPQ